MNEHVLAVTWWRHLDFMYHIWRTHFPKSFEHETMSVSIKYLEIRVAICHQEPYHIIKFRCFNQGKLQTPQLPFCFVFKSEILIILMKGLFIKVSIFTSFSISYLQSLSGHLTGDYCISQLLSVIYEIQSSFDCNPTKDARGVFLDISKL